MNNEQILIKIDQLRPSKTNPRKHFDPKKMEELTESVKRHGVLQPILVRTLDGDLYEVVAGERRYKAAKAADLKQIPAVIKELTDAEVLEIQVIENLQRDDLHPLEEAEGYKKLLDLSQDLTVDGLALKVGKSKAYVYARLKLSELPEEAKKLFWKGDLNPSTALLIARIPDPQLAKQAAKEITQGRDRWDDDGPMSYREAFEHIQRNYMLRLSEAPFQTSDPDLYPQAGPCTTCPKRTGNQRELFDDIKHADVCTDLKCFAKKKDLAWEQMKALAQEKGQKVIDGKEADKMFPYPHSSSMSHEYSRQFVDLNQRCELDPKDRHWQRLLGKHAPPATLVRDQRGEVHQLLTHGQAKDALKAAGHDFKSTVTRGGTVVSEADRKQKSLRAKQLKIRKAVITEAIEAMIEAIEVKGPDPFYYEFLLEGTIHRAWHDAIRDVANDRSIEAKKMQYGGRDYGAALLIYSKTLPERGKLGLLFQLVMRFLCGSLNEYNMAYSKEFKGACTHYGVKLDKIEAQLKEKMKGKNKGS